MSWAAAPPADGSCGREHEAGATVPVLAERSSTTVESARGKRALLLWVKTSTQAGGFSFGCGSVATHRTREALPHQLRQLGVTSLSRQNNQGRI